jgi:hypothetical protein
MRSSKTGGNAMIFSSAMKKVLIISMVFFFVNCLILILLPFSIERINLLFLIAYILYFLTVVQYIFNTARPTRQEISLLTIISMPLLWFISFGFFFLAISFSMAGPTNESRIFLLLNRFTYISGWIPLLLLIDNFFINPKRKYVLLTLLSFIVFILLSFYFYQQSNMLYGGKLFTSELLFLIFSTLFYLGSYSIHTHTAWRWTLNTTLILCLLIILIIDFTITSRAKYDFIILGPTLLFIAAATRKIVRGNFISIKTKIKNDPYAGG